MAAPRRDHVTTAARRRRNIYVKGTGRMVGSDPMVGVLPGWLDWKLAQKTTE